MRTPKTLIRLLAGITSLGLVGITGTKLIGPMLERSETETLTYPAGSERIELANGIGSVRVRAAAAGEDPHLDEAGLIAAAGGEADPLDWPAQPLGLGPRRAHREEREPCAGRQVGRHARRAGEHGVRLGQQDRRRADAAGEDVQRRQRVIEPRPGEAHGEDEGRGDARQGLLEVGGVLLGDVVQHRGEPGAGVRGADAAGSASASDTGSGGFQPAGRAPSQRARCWVTTSG